jgi:hypothetical protein
MSEPPNSVCSWQRSCGTRGGVRCAHVHRAELFDPLQLKLVRYGDRTSPSNAPLRRLPHRRRMCQTLTRGGALAARLGWSPCAATHGEQWR